MKTLIYSQEDLDLILSLKTDEKDNEIERLNNIINELEKGIFKIRQSTFIKYNSNEWNNCLSYNDDIAPLLKIIHKSRELKESVK